MKYRSITRTITITPQILKFLKNTLLFKFEFMKLGKIRKSINIKAIDGIISSNSII